MQITKKGIPTDVVGTLPVLGEKAPHFTLTDLDDQPITNASLHGDVVLLSVFPDINTRVCDLQTRHFFSVADQLDGVRIVNVSNNTKAEFESWCATNGIDSMMLRDADHSFATAFGIWLPEFELLARSVFVLDRDGNVVYQELVPEMASEPNYDAALEAAKRVL